MAEVKATAAHANVSCKVSGIFQRSGRMPAPKEAYYAPIFEVVYEAFGEDRVIYGSNWPVTDRGANTTSSWRSFMIISRPKGGRFWRSCSGKMLLHFMA